MKTGMHYPLLGLFALMAIAIIGSIWKHVQTEVAIAQLTAQSLGPDLPGGWLAFGEIGTFWVVKAILGSLLAGAGTAIGLKFWNAWKKKKRQNAWVSGPNANYQRQQPAPRGVSDSELYRMMLYQQMQNGVRPPRSSAQNRMVNDDDEPEIVF